MGHCYLLLLGLIRLWPVGFLGRGATFTPLRSVTSVGERYVEHHAPNTTAHKNGRLKKSILIQ